LKTQVKDIIEITSMKEASRIVEGRKKVLRTPFKEEPELQERILDGVRQAEKLLVQNDFEAAKVIIGIALSEIEGSGCSEQFKQYFRKSCVIVLAETFEKEGNPKLALETLEEYQRDQHVRSQEIDRLIDKVSKRKQ